MALFNYDIIIQIAAWIVYAVLSVWAVALAAGCLSGLFVTVRSEPKVDSGSVSVLVAAWNEADSIASCIDSLKQTEYPQDKVEIIVVGGGTDQTPAICRSLAEGGQIRFIETNERKGKWYDLNQSLSACSGEVIAFTDGDCRVDREWLGQLTGGLSNDCDGVIGLVLPSSDSNYIAKGFQVLLPPIGVGASIVSKTTAVPFFSGYSSAFKKHVFSAIKFEPSLIEDVVFTQKARRAFKLQFNPSANTYHDFAADTVEFYKEVSRWIAGYFTEIRRSHSLGLTCVGATLVAMPVLSVLFLVDLLRGDYGLLALLGIVAILGFSYCAISLARCKRLREIIHFPYAVLLIAVLGILSSVAVASNLVHRKTEWRLVEKARATEVGPDFKKESRQKEIPP